MYTLKYGDRSMQLLDISIAIASFSFYASIATPELPIELIEDASNKCLMKNKVEKNDD